MKHTRILLACLALSLGGCVTARDATTAAATTADAVGVPAPVTVANKTVLDESLGRGAEVAYKAWRLLLETGTDAGIVKGPRAAQLSGLDNRAFTALTAVRAAYRAGNDASYRKAVNDALAAVDAATAAYKGK